ncbi:NnrS family protein [Noviherbaspirillum aerium]|uniref:NnrS family protein n=1 Tax=Noviherbaspirillum aerium TaxID=2588497 RepID=UPI00124C9F20|nr:NnrS family protein [Noviherbaspirillum aerium]
MALITIEGGVLDGREPQSRNRPLFRLGFRPFYLLGAAFAAVSVPLWIAHLYGWLRLSANITASWHAHEMVFGFAAAIIIGFMYTAGRNWTGLWTPRGKTLAAICAVWLAGRAAMLFAGPAAAAVADMAFLPVAAYPLYQVLKRAGNKRNMMLIVLLGLLTACNAGYHAAALGWTQASPTTFVEAAILVIVIIEAIIGGRVIPMFTRNGAPGSAPVIDDRRDRIVMGATLAAAAGIVAGVPGPLMGALATCAAVAQATRLFGWRPAASLRHPLLWILHLSYGWIPIGFALMALHAFGIVAQSAALHALAVGSMAGLIIGMITRTALGHTGRQLKAGRIETAMYVLIQAGAVARVAAALGIDPSGMIALLAAAVCWSAAFGLYLALYGPYLFAARVDGGEG